MSILGRSIGICLQAQDLDDPPYTGENLQVTGVFQKCAVRENVLYTVCTSVVL